MKRLFLLVLCLAMVLALVTAMAEAADEGEFSKGWIDVINGLSIPVVVSSRIDDGVIIKDNLLCSDTVAANNLTPQKAAILLRLALLRDASREYLEALYLQY